MKFLRTWRRKNANFPAYFFFSFFLSSALGSLKCSVRSFCQFKCHHYHRTSSFVLLSTGGTHSCDLAASSVPYYCSSLHSFQCKKLFVCIYFQKTTTTTTKKHTTKQQQQKTKENKQKTTKNETKQNKQTNKQFFGHIPVFLVAPSVFDFYFLIQFRFTKLLT